MRIAALIVVPLAFCMSPAAGGASGPDIHLGPKWVFNTSHAFAGITFGAGHQSCQTVWDVDDDGVNEILFGTRRGASRRLWCIDQGGRLEWVYPPIHNEGLPGDPTSTVSLVDVNGDGTYELCFAGRGGRLHVLTGDGLVVWIRDNPNGGADMYGPPQAYDVNGDGFVEFFVGDDRGYLHCVGHDGQIIWSHPVAGKAIMAQPTIADVDQDGEYEILLGSLDHNLYCFDARTCLERWRFDAGAPLMGPVVVVDANADGEYEVLVCSDETSNRPGTVFAVNHAGLEIWNWQLPRRGTLVTRHIRFPQACGDVDDDGRLDMVVMSNIGVFCIDIGGDMPATKWEINLTRWSEEGMLPRGAQQSLWSSYQLMADIDGDNEIEVLLLGPFPVVVDGTTGRLETYYLTENVAVDRGQENGAWWGDVDSDGLSEWICELNGRTHPETQIYCLTLNGVFPARSPWPEYYHCADPAAYQNRQDWLTLKGAYSNSLWLPIPMVHWQIILALAALGGQAQGRGRGIPRPGGGRSSSQGHSAKAVS